MSEVRTLLESWSVSRGRDTYGYNICRLDDTATGKRYRCMGGGYDMTGTVLAEWLQDVFQDRLRAIADESYAVAREGQGYAVVNQPDLYGMTAHYAAGESAPLVRVSIDGACGLSSVERIAKRIGVEVRHIVNRRGHTVGFTVTVD